MAKIVYIKVTENHHHDKDVDMDISAYSTLESAKDDGRGDFKCEGNKWVRDFGMFKTYIILMKIV